MLVNKHMALCWKAANDSGWTGTTHHKPKAAASSLSASLMQIMESEFQNAGGRPEEAAMKVAGMLLSPTASYVGAFHLQPIVVGTHPWSRKGLVSCTEPGLCTSALHNAARSALLIHQALRNQSCTVQAAQETVQVSVWHSADQSSAHSFGPRLIISDGDVQLHLQALQTCPLDLEWNGLSDSVSNVIR